MRFTFCADCGERLIEKELGDEGMVPYCKSCDKPFFDMFSSCVISLVYNDENQVAVLNQDYISTEYKNLISGYMKPGERAEEAATREIYEETGLKISSLDFVGTYWFGKKDMLMIAFIAKAEDRDFTLSDEVDGAQWVSAEEALDLVHPEGSVSYSLVKKFLEKLK